MNFNHINKSILQNYRNLRTRIGILSFAFPLILVAVGYCWSIKLQPTLSNYYFAPDLVDGRVDLTPVRLWFCGILFIVGFFLYRYRGFSKNEDRWLSLAGSFALGVAVFPMSVNGKNDYDFVLAPFGLTQLSLHGICAVLAFACIAVVIVWYADSTLSELKEKNPSAYRRYKAAYFGIAVFMVVSIGISISLKYLLPVPPVDPSGIWAIAAFWQGASILAAETAGIWAFAAYWFVKNSELTAVGKVWKARGVPFRPDLVDKL